MVENIELPVANMTPEEEAQIYRDALETWGAEYQSLMVIEEMSELTKEICKQSRGFDRVEQIAEELADVQIVTKQMEILYGCTDRVEAYKQYKLARLRNRIEKAKHGEG